MLATSSISLAGFLLNAQRATAVNTKSFFLIFWRTVKLGYAFLVYCHVDTQIWPGFLFHYLLWLLNFSKHLKFVCGWVVVLLRGIKINVVFFQYYFRQLRGIITWLFYCLSMFFTEGLISLEGSQLVVWKLLGCVLERVSVEGTPIILVDQLGKWLVIFKISVVSVFV